MSIEPVQRSAFGQSIAITQYRKNGAIDALPATVENAITIERTCAHTTHRLCRGVSMLPNVEQQIHVAVALA